jgi:anti-anti-sigma factor
MEIREFREGDVLVLAPDGSLAGSDETGALETKMGAALKAGTRLLVVDCAGVGQLTSAAIRALLQASRKLGRTAGRLVLCGMNAKVQKAFSISGFDKDFTVVATREEALRRVTQPVRPVPSRTAAASPAKGAVGVEPIPVVQEAPQVAVQPSPVAKDLAPASVAPAQAPSPPAPDPREAMAAALLDALGVHPGVARSGSAAPPGLDALANGVLAALRARAS